MAYSQVTTPHLARVEDERGRRPRPEFAGLSYERASRLAAALIERAVDTCSWYALPEALIELRTVMEAHVARARDGGARLRDWREAPSLEQPGWSGTPHVEAGPGASGEYMDRG